MKNVIGVISDTHGLLRTEIIDYFNDCQMIIHAGDIGKYEVIEKLKKLAPVRVVRGNVDISKEFDELPLTEAVRFENKNIYILHDISKLNLNPEEQGYDYVIYGHSHKPLERLSGGVVFLNPGSAGPRRFKLPISAAKIIIHDGETKTEFYDIK